MGHLYTDNYLHDAFFVPIYVDLSLPEGYSPAWRLRRYWPVSHGKISRMHILCTSVLLAVTYIPYILTETPSNLVLKKVGPRTMLAWLCTMWGAVSTFQCLVQNYAALLAYRFFLGLCEGGLFPGFVLYPSDFY